MTHDLIRNLLFGLEAGVKKIVVSDLQGRHLLRRDLAGARRAADQRGFAAQRRSGDRASPGLPDLRRRNGAEDLPDNTAVAEVGNNEELRKWLESLSDEDLGRYKM